MRLALVQYSSKYSGSTISGQMIANGMLDRGWDVDVVFGFDGPFVEGMRKPKCSTQVITHRNWLRSPGLTRFARNLIAERRVAQAFVDLFRKVKPDLVYINTLVSYAAAVAAKRLGLPVIWHVRELFSDNHGELSWPTMWTRPLVRRWIGQLSDQLVVNSHAVGINVLGENFQAANVANAVDKKFFGTRQSKTDSRQSLGLPTDGHLIGLPGTLRPVKGHEFLFQAIPAILQRVPNCHFAITGALQSEYAKSIVAKAESISERIIFTDAIDDMLSFYHACDVCTVPSMSEPFGRTAIECFATRTPLVASSVGGLREIVQHDQNGLLVDFGDTDGLTQSLLGLLLDEQHANRLATQAYEDAERQYTAEAYARNISDIIDCTVNSSH